MGNSAEFQKLPAQYLLPKATSSGVTTLARIESRSPLPYNGTGPLRGRRGGGPQPELRPRGLPAHVRTLLSFYP